jgi:tellurite resistance protein TerC
MTAVPLWAWGVTLAVLAVLIVIDLVLTRGPESSLRAAAIESALWFGAALAFGAVLWLWRGPVTGSQYLAGYLLERALSLDNVFVFVLLFVSMRIPPELQKRILFLGVVGALVLRGVFIAAGGALIESVSWIFYVFGAMVLLAGARMFRAGEGGSGDNFAVRGLRRVLPVTEHYDGNRLLTRVSGRAMATPLLVALVAIAVTDVVFALDSIPAVFGVTRDLFVVFTSNAFAVLGLRALYFLLAGSADRFVYLKPGIALLLVFIGVKMLLYDVVHIPIWVSLVVIAVVAGGAIGASLWRDRRCAAARGPSARRRIRRRAAPRPSRIRRLSRVRRPTRGPVVRERAGQPAGRLPALVRGRDRLPGAGRGPPGAAQRDHHHHARRGDRGQRRSSHRAAGGVRSGRGVPRRQPVLPARPQVRPVDRAPVLPEREGR